MDYRTQLNAGDKVIYIGDSSSSSPPNRATVGL